MDPNGIDKLSFILNEIAPVEEEKLQWEQRLGPFWKHLLALDLEVIASAMQQIWDRIRGLEARKRVLVQEQQALIVQTTIDHDNRGGDNKSPSTFFSFRRFKQVSVEAN